METTLIDINKIKENQGQIQGVPANPRKISDEKMEQLKHSIKELPDMLSLRELLVFPLNGDFIVIGGNMRLRACKALGYAQIPCKVISGNTPPPCAKSLCIRG